MEVWKAMSNTNNSNYSKFVTPQDAGDRMRFEGCDVHVVEHPPDESREPHTHEEEHIVFMRTGRMNWGVDGEVHETEPGDMIVTPGGVPHSYEVLGDEPSKIICITAPPEKDSDPGHE
jgi:quercetin dioxygenase-like cupin family protein